VDLVQVRGKVLPAGELEELAAGWVERLAGLPNRVIVNDRTDAALAANADGVHLGPDDVPVGAARGTAPGGFVIGTSAHDRDELLRAQAAGADYAGLGAFHATGTKPGARPLDLDRDGLRTPIENLSIPVLAIGGIDASRIAGALRVPAVTGIAVSAAVQAADDPEQAIERLREALEEAWKLRREEG
jgi:thiamine-phosphate pyrophosphorylase